MCKRILTANAALRTWLVAAASLIIGSLSPQPAEATDVSREQALSAFETIHEVATHRRCTNCHGSDWTPRQREGVPHNMNIRQTARKKGGDIGIAGLSCVACHQGENSGPLGRVPGAGEGLGAEGDDFFWHMPPPEMTLWSRMSQSALCAQWTGLMRTKPMPPQKMLEHVSTDPLVAWAWNPGADREPAPGDHKEFIDAFTTWVDGKTPCP